jgi:23S rRNA (pseudouridine1915-N3)-methyltransferase
MLLHIVARGKIGRSPEAELTDRYLGRINWKTRITELPDKGGNMPASDGARMIILDERGKAMRSTDFAALLGRWRDEGVRETQFLIGAADGHPADIVEKADLALSFGPATWPHLLCRAMLAEQLFRAVAILAGHPYHREGRTGG